MLELQSISIKSVGKASKEMKLLFACGFVCCFMHCGANAHPASFLIVFSNSPTTTNLATEHFDFSKIDRCWFSWLLPRRINNGWRKMKGYCTFVRCEEFYLYTCSFIILFWLLFEPKAVRISPPLNISIAEIRKGCAILLEVLTSYKQ